MFTQILIAASAALTLLLGILHLQGSFFLFDKDLEPSDDALKMQMQKGTLKISPKTNVWRAWIGFNAIVSLGLLLFGLVFGYLALFRFDDLANAPVLLWVGGLYLTSLTVVSWLYLFYLPALGFTLCFVLYAVGGVAASL